MSTINIANVRVNGGTQSRSSIDRGVVSDYAEAVRDGATFPPITVFFDGASYWLADGFHRYEAYSAAQIYDVPADIRQGTQRDAILFSVGANASHGLRRTNDDKRRAVLTLLNDPEWAAWSDREIARQCGVGNRFVGDVRKTICAPNTDNAERIVTRNGTTYKQNTANIGASSKADQMLSEQEAPSSGPVKSTGPAETTPASNAAQKTPAPSGEPVDPERRKLAKLTTDALIDEVLGLRADLTDEKAKSARLKKEREDLASKLAEALAGEQGRVIGNLQRQLDQLKGRIAEHQTAAKRWERKAVKAEARVKELENMEVVIA